jgi:hypothetical protein
LKKRFIGAYRDSLGFDLNAVITTRGWRLAIAQRNEYALRNFPKFPDERKNKKFGTAISDDEVLRRQIRGHL